MIFMRQVWKVSNGLTNASVLMIFISHHGIPDSPDQGDSQCSA